MHIVQEIVTLDGNKLKGIPSECFESQIMLWHMDMPTFTLKTAEEKKESTAAESNEEQWISHDMRLSCEETCCDVTFIMYIFIEAGTAEY